MNYYKFAVGDLIRRIEDRSTYHYRCITHRINNVYYYYNLHTPDKELGADQNFLENNYRKVKE